MRDTHPDAERVHIEMLRKAGPRRRAVLASRLTNQSKWRARQGIARANPNSTKEEQAILFIEVHYGSDLAQRVRDSLRKAQRR